MFEICFFKATTEGESNPGQNILQHQIELRLRKLSIFSGFLAKRVW
jgi:hypothetical protein